MDSTFHLFMVGAPRISRMFQGWSGAGGIARHTEDAESCVFFLQKTWALE
jgi:hypothetical protein